MNEFTINGMIFQHGNISVPDQIKLVKRLSPLIPALTLMYAAKKGDMETPEIIAGIGPKLLQLFSDMSDEDAEFVINTCLDTVEIKQGDIAWSRIRVSNRIMFQEIDLFVTGYICWVVLGAALAPFFSGLESLSSGVSRK